MGSKLYLLASTSLRERWRWARQHLYTLLVLGPLVLGMTYRTLVQLASYDLALGPLSVTTELLIAAAFVAATIAVNLSRASQELYHVRRPTGYAEALPVARATHLHFALLIRACHTLLLALALLVTRHVLLNERIGAASFLALLIFCALMILSETYAALNWIHWGHRRSKESALVAVIVLTATLMTASLLIVLFFTPEDASLGRETFAPRRSAWAALSIAVAGCSLAALLYMLTRSIHEKWRAEDIDYAQRLEQGARLRLNVMGALRRERLPQTVRAMLARDLYLTVRVFSSAVYVAACVSVLLLILLVTVVAGGALPSAEEALGGLSDLGWASATWLPASLATKGAVVLIVTSLVSLVPVLVSYQIRHVWLERALGSTGKDAWLAKLWYARLLTLPPVIATYVLGVGASGIGTSADGVPLTYLLPLLAECLWLWWMTSTIGGALAFEMPDRPELALVLILSLCLSLGALSAAVWPMGLGFYGMSIAQARERGMSQAARYLATEEM